jgi:hypothetical protein
MPIKTTLCSAGSPSSAMTCRARYTCDRISCAESWRTKPILPVAQNTHALLQPTWSHHHTHETSHHHTCSSLCPLHTTRMPCCSPPGHITTQMTRHIITHVAAFARCTQHACPVAAHLAANTERGARRRLARGGFLRRGSAVVIAREHILVRERILAREHILVRKYILVTF